MLDARALFSNIKVADLLDPVVQAKKAALERHRLFPKGHLERLGINESRDRNQIANYALVEWPDNASISDSSPQEYYPKMAERFTAEELERMMHWHALPHGWDTMAYDEFLVARRKALASVIREGFNVLSGRCTAVAGHVPSSGVSITPIPD